MFENLQLNLNLIAAAIDTVCVFKKNSITLND